MTTVKRELFGGAMTIHLPENVVDVSDFREVPDNQEVFTHPATEQNIILEMLEYVNEPDEQAIRTHYADIAGLNDAATDEDTQVLHDEKIPAENISMKQCKNAWFISGKQNVAKFNETSKNEVGVHMAVMRLPQYDTDVLLTYNDPVKPQPTNDGGGPTPNHPWTIEQFKNAVLSIEIVDEGIFG